MSWRIPVSVLARITGTISWLYVSYSDKTSIEQDVESGQRTSSTIEEVDHEIPKEQTHKPQTPIWYGYNWSLARSSLFPRKRKIVEWLFGSQATKAACFSLERLIFPGETVAHSRGHNSAHRQHSGYAGRGIITELQVFHRPGTGEGRSHGHLPGYMSDLGLAECCETLTLAAEYRTECTRARHTPFWLETNEELTVLKLLHSPSL